jgi:uncharacterized protein YdeI (YjbR/CyaY-like superfamily)
MWTICLQSAGDRRRFAAAGSQGILVAVPSVVPNPKRIRGFRSAAAFETWLAANHARQPELWLRIYKKASGVATVTYPEALDVALCWGWIDGLRKPLDARSFLQRFGPRQPRSLWSQINRDHVARLTAAGRMTPHGQRHVDAAKTDGRWARAYAPIRSASQASVPADLRRAIAANPRALAKFKTLGRMNLFVLGFRTNNMRTEAGRARKIEELVAMLARGETIVPERPTRGRRETAGSPRRISTSSIPPASSRRR